MSQFVLSSLFFDGQNDATPEDAPGNDTRQLIIERDSNRLGPLSNLRQTGFNYVNSIIGSGVIGKYTSSSN